MKTAEEYEEVIRWKKKEFHENGWNAMDINAGTFMNCVHTEDDPETIAQAMLWNMLDGDTILKGDSDHPDKDLTVRYYCDNLDESRKPVFSH